MPAPVESKDGFYFPYEFHQVAVLVPRPEIAVSRMEAFGGNCVMDKAELRGKFIEPEHLRLGKNLFWSDVTTSATMFFCYDFGPYELEFLHYQGFSRHQLDLMRGHSKLSHMSTYVDDVREEVGEMYRNFGVLPYHRFVTQQHTNPAVAGKKRFIEAIYDTRAAFGFDIKLIQKVPHDYDDSLWLDWSGPDGVFPASR